MNPQQTPQIAEKQMFIQSFIVQGNDSINQWYQGMIVKEKNTEVVVQEDVQFIAQMTGELGVISEQAALNMPSSLPILTEENAER